MLPTLSDKINSSFKIVKEQLPGNNGSLFYNMNVASSESVKPFSIYFKDLYRIFLSLKWDLTEEELLLLVKCDMFHLSSD